MTQLIYGLEEGLGSALTSFHHSLKTTRIHESIFFWNILSFLCRLAPDLAAVLIAFSLKTSVDLTT